MARTDNVTRASVLGTASLAVSGVLFVLYPAIRPFSDESGLQGARAFASTAWIVAHVLAVTAFILLALGLFGVQTLLVQTPVERLALPALVATWIGVGLALSFYGAEAYGLHAIGEEALARHGVGLLSVADEVRRGPGLWVFVVGLVMLAVGAIMFAIAVWRSGTLARWSGVPLAVGLGLYLPQFAATQPIRVAHGLLVGSGCVWIAAVMWRQSRA